MYDSGKFVQKIVGNCFHKRPIQDLNLVLPFCCALGKYTPQQDRNKRRGGLIFTRSSISCNRQGGKRVYLGERTCDIFLCFGAIVFLLYLCFASSLLYCSFFVLRHR